MHLVCARASSIVLLPINPFVAFSLLDKTDFRLIAVCFSTESKPDSRTTWKWKVRDEEYEGDATL